MKHLYILLFLVTFSFGGKAQQPLTDRILIEFMTPGDPDANARGYNLLPWPEEAKAPAYKAAEIWASYLEITVPIRVKFGWCDNIEPNAQGGSTYSYQYTDGYYYPLSLINQLLGYDRNPDVVDIICVFNSKVDWYFGLEEKQQWSPDPDDPTVFRSKNSIIPTMLHEVCHGLGVGGDSFDILNGKGEWGGYLSGKARIYDTYIGDENGNQLINTAIYPNKSTKLAEALTSDAVYWIGENATKANNGKPVKIHAPKAWSISSICHIATEYGRTENDLMSNGKGGVTSNNGMDNNYTFSPGPIVLGMLQDMGWTVKDDLTANETIRPNPSVYVYTMGNQIVIKETTIGQPVLISDFSGRVVYSGRTKEGTTILNHTSGLYIVRIGSESFKVKL